jgi:hypothetical protein
MIKSLLVLRLSLKRGTGNRGREQGKEKGTGNPGTGKGREQRMTGE